MIRILIADDQALVRAGFKMILDAEPEVDVVGEASDGAQGIDAARELDPDVVLMDIRMPELDGLEATRRLTASGERPRVLILTTFDLDEYVYEAIRAGASGFLLKDARPEELLGAVRAVLAGDAVVAPSATRRLLDRFADRLPVAQEAVHPEALGSLTDREMEVLRLVARGMSNAEIAAELIVSETTVKTHVARLLMKLGLRDRVQAVVLAYETGFVAPEG